MVPVVEFSSVAASLQSIRWLPHDCDAEEGARSGETDYSLGPLLLRELARGWLRTKIGGTTLLYSLLGSCAYHPSVSSMGFVLFPLLKLPPLPFRVCLASISGARVSRRCPPCDQL